MLALTLVVVVASVAAVVADSWVRAGRLARECREARAALARARNG